MTPDPWLFQMMAEQVKDYAMFLLDLEGRVISWNVGARAIKGYEAEEIIGRHFSVFYPEDAVRRRWPEYELEAAIREGRFEDEGYRVRKDGTRFWANVIVTAMRDADGRLIAFSKITRDLTGRRRQEEALRQSEERFRLLVDGVVDYAIYMLDADGVVTSWNPGAERIKGYRRDEILGRHFSNFYTPEDVKAAVPWQELAAARRNGRAEQEGWRVRRNGDRFWARTVITELKDAEGRHRGFAKVTQDLSRERRILELEETAKRLNEFIAMLAHEIRNPLAPIRMAVDLSERLPRDDPRQDALRSTIDRQSRHLVRITEDLIDISRVTSGKLSLQRATISLADVVERATETAAPLIEERGHRLEVELPSSGPFVVGDTDRLIQVFSNLLNNAARYTPVGGNIGIVARVEDGKAVVAVRDNGRGIKPHAIEGIFTMFVQEHSPFERVGQGLGVGLALARNIVELHGGTIEAASEGEGRGSEFTVRLPLAPEALQQRPAQPEVAVRRHAQDGGRRVLVVDDNTDAAQTLVLLLHSLGHETRTASDGIAALQAAEEFRPDVVLLDIGLPGISGYDVARELRSRRGGGLRIVAVTGWGKDEDRRHSAAAGFDLHLVKPVDEQELRRALEAVPGGTVH